MCVALYRYSTVPYDTVILYHFVWGEGTRAPLCSQHLVKRYFEFPVGAFAGGDSNIPIIILSPLGPYRQPYLFPEGSFANALLGKYTWQ